MKIAINYTSNRLKDAEETVVKDGIFYISSKQIKYVIDPAIIVTGLIDNDTSEDAIVSITSYYENFLSSIEHLILLRTDGKFKVTAVIKVDMKILGIKDRIIFAEMPKVAPDSPNYDCSSCKEVIKYRYYNGDLLRTE